MTETEDYQVINWKDPELMFGEEYQPFDLVRDLNGDTIFDGDFVEKSRDLIVDSTQAYPARKVSIMDDEVKEYNSHEAPLNFTTTISEEEQSEGCVNEAVLVTEESAQISPVHSDLIQVKHISGDGPLIFVTKKRHSRILKQRTKRLAFLQKFPEYARPYKNREKKIKDRKRNSLGKFSNKMRKDQIISFELDASEVLEDPDPKRNRKT
ncbi:unnamed protein product [Moneuplotes crassus]|uniref:Uncharacterized protein n=1 Tax=Euplotes crassus TaxID=5936 RepID=A0AAD1XSF5_EUPCR|nr:unnamed protein product [Moneuplotes crassus]